jgi:D-xylose transport system substrate-binding protein
MDAFLTPESSLSYLFNEVRQFSSTLYQLIRPEYCNPFNKMNILKFRLTIFFAVLTTFAWSQKIGLLMDSYVIDRWYKDEKYFIEKVKALGGTVVQEVAHGDADEQIKLGKKLIESGIDALVIIPVSSDKAAVIAEAARKANIPVISYDRFILSKDLSFYVSYNNLAVGHLQAEYALNKKPQGNYLIINGPVSDNNALQFKKGQMEVLKPAIDAGKVKIIGDIVLDSWSEMEAMMKLQEFLTPNGPKPDVIIAANDAIAMGTVQTISKEMLGNTVITGQDADLLSLKYIVAGTQSMTIYKPIKPLAELAAEIAMKLARKETIPNASKLKNGGFEVPAILLKPVVVDKTNYKETVVKDGHVQLSELAEQ